MPEVKSIELPWWLEVNSLITIDTISVRYGTSYPLDTSQTASSEWRTGPKTLNSLSGERVQLLMINMYIASSDQPKTRILGERRDQCIAILRGVFVRCKDVFVRSKRRKTLLAKSSLCQSVFRKASHWLLKSMTIAKEGVRFCLEVRQMKADLINY